MPLTPPDVANKQFRIAFRGYSLDEVDAFLDEVETELSRLLCDNAELKNRPAAAPPAEPLRGLEGQEAALRTLLLAQRTADEAIAEARAEAEQMLSEARAEADTTVTSARSEAESALASARSEAESTLGSARSEAETALSTSKSRAARLDAEVAAQIQAATGDLDERRRMLEARIAELRAFEREYRTRLKAYLEAQLRDLGSRTAPDDSGAGVPAGARSAAVGSPPAAAVGASPPGGPPAAAPGAVARPDAPEDDTRDGPPREAPPSGLHAVPQVSSTAGAEPVGPSRVDPHGRQAGGEGEPPTRR
ncbi:MAG: DivIVA domain-containing protein [Mycobacteriales bacterium]